MCDAVSSRSSATSLLVASFHRGLSPSVSFNSIKFKFNSSSGVACSPSISTTIHYSRTSYRIAKPKKGFRLIVESKQQQSNQIRLERVVSEEFLNNLADSIVVRILNLSPDKIPQGIKTRRNVAALLRLGASEVRITNIFLANPELFSYDYFDNINLVYDHFLSIGMSKRRILKNFRLYSHLLTQDVQEVKEILKFLTTEIGFSNVDNIARFPSYIYGLPLSTLRSRANYLRELGLHPLRRMLEKVPILFKYSEEDIALKVDHFGKLLGKEKCGPLLCKTPRFLTMRMQVVDEIFDNLTLIFGVEETKLIIEKQPAVLNVTWPIIKEKIIYIQETMNRELREISLYPTVLTCSLENRIKPRFRALRALGVKREYNLGHILCTTDASFIKRFGVYPILSYDTSSIDKKE